MLVPLKYHKESSNAVSVRISSEAFSSTAEIGRGVSGMLRLKPWSRMKAKHSTLLAMMRMSYFSLPSPSVVGCNRTNLASTRKITDA